MEDKISRLTAPPIVGHEHPVGMRMHVDETGNDQLPSSIDHAIGRRARQSPNSNDSLPTNTDIGPELWAARPVENAAVQNEKVKLLGAKRPTE